jgi:hypothetical protein
MAATAAIPELLPMCRNIKTLFNFEPPATEQEIRAASLQFVRKLSGFNTPSKANQVAFAKAVDDVAAVARTLLESLVTNAEPRDREVEAARARERSALRFSRIPQT